MNQEFKDKYGTTPRTAINRAIRAEVPGMDGIMDALEGLSVARQHARGERRRLLQTIEDAYVTARDAAKALIAMKYKDDNEWESLK